VLALKITLYRTSGDSPIVEALIEAATRANRLLPSSNCARASMKRSTFKWARRLEEAGAHVIYGVVGFKNALQSAPHRAAATRIGSGITCISGLGIIIRARHAFILISAFSRPSRS